MMETFRKQLCSFQVWLEERNKFSHVNTLSVTQQRLVTRIYILVFVGE